MALGELFFIMGCSIFNALMVEFISWVLIYNTEDYQRQKQVISRLEKKVESKKTKPATKGKGKQIDRFEDSIKNANQSLFMASMKSKAVVTVSLVLLYAVLNSVFDGVVVAKLPFEPVWLFQKLSHRNLLGTDMTDCSFTFFFLLCNLSISAN
eukprot:CAMPEP_0201486084 /NCGR_PEP_ID=MMETSP0151_2-20130828/10149_1 /ASSEMBLY_ACC=CAM_ASM_000257 /TAXON_ID=200890 /ORGANISM="Paramoeba atlantica, Strain 621/1 / CCAP 1560/9" /LENGTH=152 /DNA_ID=CAMNT_0047870519 /DNA_START=80 /DNA_END=535 /DNA_ORIENTATION=-